VALLQRKLPVSDTTASLLELPLPFTLPGAFLSDVVNKVHQSTESSLKHLVFAVKDRENFVFQNKRQNPQGIPRRLKD